jgi:hypothetical protein
VRGLGASLAAAAALTATVMTPPVAANGMPAYSGLLADERAKAIAQPSVVLLEYLATGIVRDKNTLEPISQKPLTVAVRCSGFVINNQGAAITLRGCVSPSADQLAAWSFEALAFERALNGDARTQFLQQMAATATFTGEAQTEPPTVLISAQLNTATTDQKSASAWPAEVVPPVNTNTDLAIVKISQPNLPVVEVAPDADIMGVTAPMAIAYVPVSPGTFTVRARNVNIPGRQVGGSDFAYLLDQELPWESRGGVIIDENGKAVAAIVVSAAGPIKAVHNSEAIANQLAAAGIKSELGPNDILYRRALDDYFGGRYSEAIKKFDSVLAAAPSNQLATTYRKQAEERQGIEGPGEPSNTPLIITIIVLGVLLLAAVVFVGLLLMSRRRRPAQGHDLLVPISASPYGSSNSYVVLDYPISAPPSADETQYPYGAPTQESWPASPWAPQTDPHLPADAERPGDQRYQ